MRSTRAVPRSSDKPSCMANREAPPPQSPGRGVDRISPAHRASSAWAKLPFVPHTQDHELILESGQAQQGNQRAQLANPQHNKPRHPKHWNFNDLCFVNLSPRHCRSQPLRKLKPFLLRKTSVMVLRRAIGSPRNNNTASSNR